MNHSNLLEVTAAFYKAENNANDANGKNNGTFVGTAKYTKGFGERGHAFLLNGTNYVKAAATSRLDVGVSTYGMTIALWVKASTWGPLIEWGDASHVGFNMRLSDINTLYVNLGPLLGYTLYVTQPPNYFYNTWRHIVVAYDKQTGFGNIYCDGKVVCSNYLNKNLRVATQSSFNNFLIGHHMINDQEILNLTASVDDVSIWNRTLSSDEVGVLYATYQTKAPSIKPTNTPTVNPIKPTFTPTMQPSFKPTARPTYTPSYKSTYIPSYKPTNRPSFKPTYTPSYKPTYTPSYKPAYTPSFKPTFKPSFKPTFKPTFKPS